MIATAALGLASNVAYAQDSDSNADMVMSDEGSIDDDITQQDLLTDQSDNDSAVVMANPEDVTDNLDDEKFDANSIDDSTDTAPANDD